LLARLNALLRARCEEIIKAFGDADVRAGVSFSTAVIISIVFGVLLVID
jgi:hypothetical protein